MKYMAIRSTFAENILYKIQVLLDAIHVDN